MDSFFVKINVCMRNHKSKLFCAQFVKCKLLFILYTVTFPVASMWEMIMTEPRREKTGFLHM